MKRPAVFVSILIIPLSTGFLFGQTWISGKVTTIKNEAITGANVYLQNTYDGTSTGPDGEFAFSTSERGEQKLLVTYLGYSDFQKIIFPEDDTIFLEVTLKENAFELEKVVITAGAFEAGGEGKREILKPLDILTTAGATGDIAGALNTLPGTQTVGESGRLFVRGGEGYETKTFIDGLQVMNFYTPSAPNTPGRARFMPYMFSGTSFSTGGYSAEYGQALSSALILNSKFLAYQDRIDISLMSVGADIGMTQAWEKSSLAAKAQYTNLDPYIGLIDQEIEWVDAPTSIDGSAAYRQKISNTGILKVFGNFNRSDFSLNQKDLSDPSVKTRTGISNRYAYLNAMVQEAIGRDWTLKTGLSYTEDRNKTGLNEATIDQAEKGLHTKFILSKTFSGNRALKMGGEYFNRHFNQDYYHPTDRLFYHAGFNEHLGALFVESDIHLSGSLLARIGLRAEYAGLSRNLHAVPRLSLALKISAYSQLSAAFGQFRQTPQKEWLMSAPHLPAERADHYILNYQISRQKRTFRLEMYYKQYHDLVKFERNEKQTTTGFSSRGFGYARGLDLFWRDNQSLKNVDYWISYSYLDTRRDYRDFPRTATPDFASRHNLSLVYKHFILPIKSQIGLTYTFASSRHYDDPNQVQFMNSRTPAYHDLSGNISYLFRQHIIVHLSATNLLGSDQIFGYEYAQTPDGNGHYAGRAIRPPAKRFLFLGVFITFSKEAVLNQLPNL